MKGYSVSNSEAVEKMALLNITGNVIPLSWFEHIKLESGKPDTIAIMLLSDIVYWYRPIEVRDEETGTLTGYRKKFAADKLQRSYSAFADLYGFTKDQVSFALKRLEKLHLIDLDFRNPTINGIKMGNVLYIGLNADRLAEITTPPTVKRNTLRQSSGTPSANGMAHPLPLHWHTNTENTTETTAETTQSLQPSENSADAGLLAQENVTERETGGRENSSSVSSGKPQEPERTEPVSQNVTLAPPRQLVPADDPLLRLLLRKFPGTKKSDAVSFLKSWRERRHEDVDVMKALVQAESHGGNSLKYMDRILCGWEKDDEDWTEEEYEVWADIAKKQERSSAELDEPRSPAPQVTEAVDVEAEKDDQPVVAEVQAAEQKPQSGSGKPSLAVCVAQPPSKPVDHSPFTPPTDEFKALGEKLRIKSGRDQRSVWDTELREKVAAELEQVAA